MDFDHSGRWFPPTTVRPSDLHAPLPSGLPFESLIPTFTMQNPGELLDRYYSRKQGIYERTDPKGTVRQRWGVFGNRPRNVGTPTSSARFVSDEIRSHGHSAVRVPVYGKDLVPNESRVVVDFRGRDQKSPSTGVHLAYLFGDESDPSRLQGAEDIVLEKLLWNEVELIIAWPGYQRERYSICVTSDNGGPLTRFDLAKQITIAYGIFFRKVEKEGLLPSATGFYNIALHQGLNSRWNTLGIQFMQLRLVRLRNTIRGSWVVDIEIIV
ncbi:hypothetical protein V8E55_003357 [Tylopilus felleus]